LYFYFTSLNIVNKKDILFLLFLLLILKPSQFTLNKHINYCEKKYLNLSLESNLDFVKVIIGIFFIKWKIYMYVYIYIYIYRYNYSFFSNKL